MVKRRDFSSDEIKSAFGPQIPISAGNRILHEVQEQRLAGTIDKTISGSPRDKGRALAWLLKNVPYDEDQAILKRLEREEKAALRPQGQQKQGKVYAESVLERTRKENIDRREKEEQERRARAKLEANNIQLSHEQALVRRQEESVERIKSWKACAKKDELHSVPQMSLIQRVGPATILSVTVVSLCVMFAQNYSPPSEAARLFSSISPAAATVGVLIGLNGADFKTVHEDIGRGPFLATFLSCGIAASNIFLISIVLRKRWEYLTMGCSGALCGILAAWCCINSNAGIRIWPLPPRATEALQPLVVLASLMALDVWGVWKGLRFGKIGFKSNIDHLSHLAGFGCGIVASRVLQSPARQKQQKSKKTRGEEPKLERVEHSTHP
ncbi:MAG: hypothetical protein Q9170_001737 [Blastenia crenularia]